MLKTLIAKEMTPARARRLATTAALIFAGAAVVLSPTEAGAQWSTAHEQYYLPGRSNWQFRDNYPAGDRLFNAFDYGHAILYEKLWTKPGASVSLLENKEYDFITRELLVHPPNLPLQEAAIEVEYAKLVPEAKMMFDWAHLLHRQIYDAWADERLTVAQKDARVQELIRYYKTRKDLAFSSQPKSMDLMEGQPYSLAFRKNYPKFNGLIWAYHWLQIGLYEPLLAGKNKDERQTGVLATVARFRQMIENPPTSMPRMMPMTAAVAPLFSARYPEAAIIFDNLHSMHDVVSDILANPAVPRNRKRAEILLAASRYRDNTSYVITPPEWREMAQAMGVENMGGPAIGFLPGFPEPTVERGVLAGHSMIKGMSGMSHSSTSGNASSSDAAGHASQSMSGMAGISPAAAPAKNTPAMTGMKMDAPKTDGTKMDGASMSPSKNDHSAQMMALQKQMMADPVIRARVEADPPMRRMVESMMAPTGAMPMAGMSMGNARTTKGATMKKSAKPAARTGSKTVNKTASKTASKPAAKKKTDPMAGMPGMNMGPKK
jgi:hypothetical protein